jgi:hypothetical protein
MTITGASFLSAPPPGSHLVYPYTDEERAMTVVAKYAAEGFKRSDAVVLILTHEHCQAIDQHLHEEGFDTAALKAEGRYQCLDAARTLASFMVKDLPNKELFNSIVAPVIKRAKQFGSVRAYGEMVSLLFEHNERAALRLEELWNEFLKEESICLLCTYDVRNKTDLGSDLTHQHSHCIV